MTLHLMSPENDAAGGLTCIFLWVSLLDNPAATEALFFTPFSLTLRGSLPPCTEILAKAGAFSFLNCAHLSQTVPVFLMVYSELVFAMLTLM